MHRVVSLKGRWCRCFAFRCFPDLFYGPKILSQMLCVFWYGWSVEILNGGRYWKHSNKMWTFLHVNFFLCLCFREPFLSSSPGEGSHPHLPTVHIERARPTCGHHTQRPRPSFNFQLASVGVVLVRVSTALFNNRFYNTVYTSWSLLHETQMLEDSEKSCNQNSMVRVPIVADNIFPLQIHTNNDITSN